MKDRLLKLLKTAAIAFPMWFVLTLLLVGVGSSTGLDEKAGWFSAFSVLSPICLAVIYVVWALKKENAPKPQKRPIKAPPSEKPIFPPTGDKKLDAAMAVVDAMDGHDFEQFCAELLERCGYQNIHVTKGSGAPGVNVMAIEYGLRRVFRCNRCSSKMGP